MKNSEKRLVKKVCEILEQPDKVKEVMKKMNEDASTNNESKPKREPSSYIKFSQKNRNEAIKALPEDKKKNVGDVAKELGKMWRELSAEEKLEYK